MFSTSFGDSSANNSTFEPIVATPASNQAPPTPVHDDKLVAKLSASEEKVSQLEREKERLQKVCF